MKTQYPYLSIVSILLLFLILTQNASAQNIISGNKKNDVTLISSGSENGYINNDKADPAEQAGDDGLYIYRPNYFLGFSPFTKGFWKLSRFGYYNWVYNFYDYTMNDYYHGMYGGWLYGRMNMYGCYGRNFNLTQFYSPLYYANLYGMNGHIIYRPLIALKNTNIYVPSTAGNNIFFTRLFERNKFSSKYIDGSDDKPDKKPKPLSLSGINAVPVIQTGTGSQREIKQINFYYKTKFDEYNNSLNRNYSNRGNNSEAISVKNRIITSSKTGSNNKGNNNSVSQVSKNTISSTVINNQGSVSNSNNSQSKQEKSGSTKK